MIRHRFAIAAATAALLLTAAPSFADPRGGHHGGGYGGHGGGYGGHHGGYGGGYYGGYGGYGGYYGGGSRFSLSLGYGYPYGNGYGRSGYGYGGYSYPSYSSYYVEQAPVYIPPATSYYVPAAPAFAAPSNDVLPTPAPAPIPVNGDAPVNIEVRVPAKAIVSLGGMQSGKTGPVRKFVSPPIAAGKEFAYEVRGTWVEDGKEVTRTRRFKVRAGDSVTVDLTRPELVGK